MASSCNQRHTVLSLMLATIPALRTSRATSAVLMHDNGMPRLTGNSHARALISMTTSGGKNPGSSGSGALLQALETSVKKALAPQADHLAWCVEHLRNFIISQTLGSQKDHSSPYDLKIR
jgi:hypothetical protein